MWPTATKLLRDRQQKGDHRIPARQTNNHEYPRWDKRRRSFLGWGCFPKNCASSGAMHGPNKQPILEAPTAKYVSMVGRVGGLHPAALPEEGATPSTSTRPAGPTL